MHKYSFYIEVYVFSSFQHGPLTLVFLKPILCIVPPQPPDRLPLPIWFEKSTLIVLIMELITFSIRHNDLNPSQQTKDFRLTETKY